METIYIETQPTESRNVFYIRGRVGNFDLIGVNRGINLWVDMYNTNNQLFDGAYVQIDGKDWTDWPAGLTEDQDYEYISSIILKKLGLLKRLKAPYFIEYPKSITAVENENINLSAVVRGNPEDFVYQWYFNESEMVGENINTLSISNVSIQNAGTYVLSISNSQGSISGSAIVNVLSKSIPQILTQPVDTVINSGQYGQLTVFANGIPNPNYQWYKNDQIIDNAISTSLIFANMQEGDAGVYHVVVSNSQGSVESNRVDVSINTDENLFQQYIFQ